MVREGHDPFLPEKLQEELNREVNAVIKLVMSEMERLAGMDPALANEPVEFNRARHAVIRKLWNLVREAIRYGAVSMERE